MHFSAGAASILVLSILGQKIGVLKSPALFQGKEMQVTRFKVMCFGENLLIKVKGSDESNVAIPLAGQPRIL